MRNALRACSLLSAGAFFVLALVVGPLHTDAYLHERYLAQIGEVGLHIGVAPNSDNTLAESLRAQEETLAVREEYLRQRESERASRDAIMYLAILVGQSILFALLLLNFYFDHRARRSGTPTVAPASG